MFKFPSAFIILFIISFSQLNIFDSWIISSQYHYTTFKNNINKLKSTNNITPQDEPFIFAGVKFYPPISSSLQKLGYKKPSAIQQVAISPITIGLSAIIHSETGSGKSLCYLLPLLKRIKISNDGVQAIIMTPSRELSIQLAADISIIMDSEDQLKTLSPYVHISISKPEFGFESIKTPIIVGTASSLYSMMTLSKNETIEKISFIVLDEVDRLLEVPGKYASHDIINSRNDGVNVAAKFMEQLVSIRKTANSLSNLQLVCASATIGRPLRREINKFLNPSNDKTIEELPVLRVNTALKNTRAVTIPSTIKHIVYLQSDESAINIKKTFNELDDSLSQKVVLVQQLWKNEFENIKKCILFTPTLSISKQIVGMMNFWGMHEVKNLRESIGLLGGENVNNLKKVKFSRNTERDFSDRDFPMKPQEMIFRANANSIGHSDQSSIERELFVASISSARGLHIKNVDLVVILNLPNSMDEYVHLAGRTGRIGNVNSKGSVISIVSFDELKKLQSWQTPLNIDLDVRHA